MPDHLKSNEDDRIRQLQFEVDQLKAVSRKLIVDLTRAQEERDAMSKALAETRRVALDCWKTLDPEVYQYWVMQTVPQPDLVAECVDALVAHLQGSRKALQSIADMKYQDLPDFWDTDLMDAETDMLTYAKLLAKKALTTDEK